MNEKFLKERYLEWSGAFDYEHHATCNGTKQLKFANKSSSEMSNDLIENHGCPEMIADMFMDSGNDFLKAGFYAGYEMACYMLKNMLQDSPLSIASRNEWNNMVLFSHVQKYYQEQGKMPKTFKELIQWINERSKSNHERA